MFIKKYIFLALIVICLANISCSTRINTIKGIKLSWALPILDKEQDTIFNWNGSSNLYFYKDITLYEKEGVFIDDDNKEEKVYTYWVYKQNYKKGVKYKGSYPDIVGVTFDVDSFLVINAFKNSNFYSKENDSLVFKGAGNGMKN